MRRFINSWKRCGRVTKIKRILYCSQLWVPWSNKKSFLAEWQNDSTSNLSSSYTFLIFMINMFKISLFLHQIISNWIEFVQKYWLEIIFLKIGKSIWKNQWNGRNSFLFNYVSERLLIRLCVQMSLSIRALLLAD